MSVILYLVFSWWAYGVIKSNTITVYSSWLGYIIKKFLICILFGWIMIPLAILKSVLFK